MYVVFVILFMSVMRCMYTHVLICYVCLYILLLLLALCSALGFHPERSVHVVDSKEDERFEKV